MPDYPRACSRCGVLTAEADFGADRSKKSGHKSHCRACERADYASRKDELQARRDAVREAAWQARLKELEVVHREKSQPRSGSTRPPSVARRSSCASSACPI